MINPLLTILMPVRNDGINLKIMLRVLRGVMQHSHEVLVVHDDEMDDGIEVVADMIHEYPNVRAVHNQTGRGVVNALRVGVSAARGDYILIFAADEVGPALAIEDMLELMEEGCDFVSCTRYAYGGRRLGGSLLGGVLSRTANAVFRHLSSTGLTDATTGIKLFRRSDFAKLNLEARPIGWAVAFEMAIKAELAGLRMGEVPIISIDRLYGGQSTFRAWPWVREYLRWFFFGIVRLNRMGRSRERHPRVRIPLSCPVR